MIMTELIDRVRYPDESPTGFDDRIPYAEVVISLERGLKKAKGQLLDDMKETLSELRRIHRERKRITA